MPAHKLARRLGARDAALIVMGGIIGSGIFMNPSVVARHLPSALLVMLAWAAGGVIALLGAGIFAELAARRPSDGGVYAYMRDAFHPALAFMYGWTLLLVSQSGGMAAAAVTFAAYFTPLTGWHASTAVIAAVAIAVFTAINALGVRSGATTQNLFMVAEDSRHRRLRRRRTLCRTPHRAYADRDRAERYACHVGARARSDSLRV